MNKIPFIIFLLIFKINYVYSDVNYLVVDAVGSYITFKNMKLDNGTNVIHYENDLAWTDNFGNYGSTYCFGSFISKNQVYSKFDLYCELKDQNNEKFWMYFSRPNTDFDAGSGKSVFIDGTDNYKILIGTECIFSTKYFEKKIFSKSKCKITDNQFKALSDKS